MGGGLEATAALWPVIGVVYAWVWRVAQALGDQGPGRAAAVRQQVAGLLGAMQRHRATAGARAGAVDHFAKVTRSYWAGLFHCYAVDGLPRTNNDLEQCFGRHRYHERRASGRKGASPGLVLRGEARLLAAAATRQHRYTAAELAGADPQRRQELRGRLEARRQRRVSRARFRRDPQAYLLRLEEQLLQSALPAEKKTRAAKRA
ncbi:MAG TPA: hypothetical protein VF880_05970 [Actinomycetes bacterium]